MKQRSFRYAHEGYRHRCIANIITPCQLKTKDERKNARASHSYLLTGAGDEEVGKGAAAREGMGVDGRLGVRFCKCVECELVSEFECKCARLLKQTNEHMKDRGGCFMQA